MTSLLLPFSVLRIPVFEIWFCRSHTYWCDANIYIKATLLLLRSFINISFCLCKQDIWIDYAVFSLYYSSLPLLYIYQSNNYAVNIKKKNFLFSTSFFCYFSGRSITLSVVVSNFLYCLYLMYQLFRKVLNLPYLFCGIRPTTRLKNQPIKEFFFN